MKQKNRLEDICVTVSAILLGLVLIFPIIYAVCGAFKTPAEFVTPGLLPDSFTNFENFRAALTLSPLMRYMLNSGSVARLIISVLAAYAFTFYDFRGKKLCFFLVLGTMMLPGDILISTNYMTVSDLGLLNSYLGMSIVSFVSASQMFMLRQNFKSAPLALKEAAHLDGCGDLHFMLSILLPISKPVLVTLFVQGVVTMWNAYLWPLLVTNQNDMRTIQVGITMLTTLEDTNYHVVLAGVAISLIPAFILFFFLRRNITRAMAAGALVG